MNVTRLNAHYQPSLRLARLALEGAGVEDAAGVITAPAYFVPMWRVWEAAVAASLTDAGVRQLHAQPEFADRFEQIAGRPRLRITLRPDLLVGSRASPRLAIELKWGPALVERYGRRRLRNEHLYQLAAYCTALECDGWLLYPLIDREVSSTYRFNNRTITIATVDLSVGQLGDLRRVSNEIGAITDPAIPGGMAA